MSSKVKYFVGFLLLAVGFFWMFFLYTNFTLPNVEEFKNRNPATTAFMEQYRGDLPLKYQWVEDSQISPFLKQAVVISEDSLFFEHHGFDWKSLWEAFSKNWKRKEIVRGGSSITQQLAKNLYLSPSKNPLRKIKEILITIALEQRLSKQRILELYLNVAEWGEGIYGAEAAAQHYYQSKASQLGPTQAAWLASILPNPRYYQKHRHTKLIQYKVSKILSLMGFKKEMSKEEEPKEEEEPTETF